MNVMSPELTLAKIWQAQWLVPGPWHTTDGQTVTVQYRGRWSAGFGPDFADAALMLGKQRVTGAVELHRRMGDWRAHGHHLDAAYNTVVLHVVYTNDGPPAITRHGHVLPTLVLAPLLAGPLAAFPNHTAALGGLGDSPCAHDYLAATTTGTLELAHLLGRAGDSRLALKAAALEAQFAVAPPGAALYSGLLDALGYQMNRAPMAALAAALPLHMLERQVLAVPVDVREETAAALLLGTAGFLDHDSLPAFIHDGERLRACWRTSGSTTAVTNWETARVRPANHPARRLLALAAWIAGTPEGLTAALLAPLTAYPDEPRLAVRALREVLRPRAAFLRGESSPIGADRAGEISVNVVLPFALVYGLQVGDEVLVTGSERVWETFPAPRDNAITRAMREQLSGTGVDAFRVRTGRHQQGLIALYQERCKARRCAQCPVAHLIALSAESDA